MAKSTWVYKKLRNFRAGIESGISALKRAFGLDRCTWSGWEGFKRYVWSSIVSYNLFGTGTDQAGFGLITHSESRPTSCPMDNCVLSWPRTPSWREFAFQLGATMCVIAILSQYWAASAIEIRGFRMGTILKPRAEVSYRSVGCVFRPEGISMDFTGHRRAVHEGSLAGAYILRT